LSSAGWWSSPFTHTVIVLVLLAVSLGVYRIVIKHQRLACRDSASALAGFTGPTVPIRVTVTHSPLAFFYNLFEPTIRIGDMCLQRPWGTYEFPVPAGRHIVSISHPWLVAQCGKNSVEVELRPGELLHVVYNARLACFLPGKMRVESLSDWHA
jgi:hypothetical protein